MKRVFLFYHAAYIPKICFDCLIYILIYRIKNTKSHEPMKATRPQIKIYFNPRQRKRLYELKNYTLDNEPSRLLIKVKFWMISGLFRARKILRKIEIQQKPRISAFTMGWRLITLRSSGSRAARNWFKMLNSMTFR